MAREPFSIRLFRLLLRIYPSEFRERFAADLQSDFAQLLASRGWRAAWSMGSLLFDVRHAVRALAKSPVFTAVTVLTLALGIGANSAIFSLVNAVLLRPLGYQSPEQLMMVHEVIPESKVPRFGVSPVDYLDLDQYQASFTDLGVYRTRSVELSGSGNPETIVVAQTSAAVLPLLGVGAAEGRTFLAEEDQSEPGGVRVPQARSAVQQRAGRCVHAAGVQSVRAAGPRHGAAGRGGAGGLLPAGATRVPRGPDVCMCCSRFAAGQ